MTDRNSSYYVVLNREFYIINTICQVLQSVGTLDSLPFGSLSSINNNTRVSYQYYVCYRCEVRFYCLVYRYILFIDMFGTNNIGFTADVRQPHLKTSPTDPLTPHTTLLDSPH